MDDSNFDDYLVDANYDSNTCSDSSSGDENKLPQTLCNATAKANFETKLAGWLIDSKCRRQNGDKLIDILRKSGHKHLKSSRTLRATLRTIGRQSKCGDNYYYCGI